jgi:hypothetical protein
MVGIRGGAEEKKRDNEVFEKVISYGRRSLHPPGHPS